MSPHKLLRFAAFGLIALVAFVAAEPTPAPAPPAPAAAPPAPEVRAANDVKITVVAILATDQNDKIDDRVSCIAHEVQKKYDTKLTGFQVHRIMCRPISFGETATFDVIADQKLAVSVENACTPDERMQLKIKAPTWGEMSYETCCGKFMPLMTRYRTPDNQVLILAVRVQPAKCSK